MEHAGRPRSVPVRAPFSTVIFRLRNFRKSGVL
jgi:hypothetical protein